MSGSKKCDSDCKGMSVAVALENLSLLEPKDFVDPVVRKDLRSLVDNPRVDRQIKEKIQSMIPHI